jgi:hypothetical protein
MDRLQVKLILDKINTLFQSIQQDNQVSSLEKDLLLSYIRKLYEAALGNTFQIPDFSKQDNEIKPQPKVETPIYEAPKIIEIPADYYDEIIVEKESPISKPVEVVQEKVEVQPVVEKIIEKEVVPQPIEPEIEIIEQTEEDPIVVVAEPKVDKVAEPKSNDPYLQFSAKVENLFTIESKNDLFTKLAESPVADLSKAFGLNEKILIINDLFGGQQNEMENVITKLNGYSNFETAKELLYRFANRFSWASENKELRAKNFIKIVRRRYL